MRQSHFRVALVFLVATILLGGCGEAALTGEEETSSDTDATAHSGGAFADSGGTGGGATATTGGASASGGTTATGGASPTGGAPATGGASPTGGAPATGGASPTGGAPAEDGPLFPAPGSTSQCPDPSLRVRFDGPPKLGTSGKLRVYDAQNAANPIYTIDMSVAQITDTVNGASVKQTRPAYVYGDEAIFVLPSAGLAYGHTYYVTLEPSVVTGPAGEATNISDPNTWRFSTAIAAPASSSSVRVALDGAGQFCGVQRAVEFASAGATITIGEGAYYGLVSFKNKNNLTLRGDERSTTELRGVNNNNLNPSTRGRPLFLAENVQGLSISDVTITNETPQDGSQAEALALLSCDQCSVRRTTIRSLQDTLLWSGRIYAEDCLIEGNVDYIWGSGAVYFNRCEIKTVGRKGYNIQARNTAGGYGYVFVDSKLTSSVGITGDVLARIDVTQYPASHVAYINCEMGSHISAAGWTVTGGGSTSSLRFWEYQSKNPQGALINTSGRAAGSRQLSSGEAATMRDPTVVLGGWDPNS